MQRWQPPCLLRVCRARPTAVQTGCPDNCILYRGFIYSHLERAHPITTCSLRRARPSSCAPLPCGARCLPSSPRADLSGRRSSARLQAPRAALTCSKSSRRATPPSFRARPSPNSPISPCARTAPRGSSRLCTPASPRSAFSRRGPAACTGAGRRDLAALAALARPRELLLLVALLARLHLAAALLLRCDAVEARLLDRAALLLLLALLHQHQALPVPLSLHLQRALSHVPHHVLQLLGLDLLLMHVLLHLDAVPLARPLPVEFHAQERIIQLQLTDRPLHPPGEQIEDGKGAERHRLVSRMRVRASSWAGREPQRTARTAHGSLLECVYGQSQSP